MVLILSIILICFMQFLNETEYVVNQQDWYQHKWCSILCNRLLQLSVSPSTSLAIMIAMPCILK